MKWFYIALGIWALLYVGQAIERYYNQDNIYMIQGGIQP